MLLFHSILRVLRRELGIKGVDLAALLEHDRTYISRVETGERTFYQADLGPLIALLRQEHNADYLRFKYHESRLTGRGEHYPRSLLTLLALHNANLYPKDEDFEAYVQNHFEPFCPDDIECSINAAQGVTRKPPKSPAAQPETEESLPSVPGKAL